MLNSMTQAAIQDTEDVGNGDQCIEDHAHHRDKRKCYGERIRNDGKPGQSGSQSDDTRVETGIDQVTSLGCMSPHSIMEE